MQRISSVARVHERERYFYDTAPVCSVLDTRWPYLGVYMSARAASLCHTARKEIASRTRSRREGRDTRQISSSRCCKISRRKKNRGKICTPYPRAVIKIHTKILIARVFTEMHQNFNSSYNNNNLRASNARARKKASRSLLAFNKRHSIARLFYDRSQIPDYDFAYDGSVISAEKKAILSAWRELNDCPLSAGKERKGKVGMAIFYENSLPPLLPPRPSDTTGVIVGWDAHA